MYLDDLTPGFRFETGSREMTEAAIMDFARQWDAQPFHIDPEAAKASIYGGIIASGFHTMLVAFNLTLETGLFNESSMGGSGFDELRWLHPVRPGDVLRVVGEVLSVTPSASRPDRGRATIQHRIYRQDGTEVSHYRSTYLLKRRP